MKKNLALITAALILILSVSGCGKKTNTQQNAQNPQTSSQTDVSDVYSQPADISKVDGQEAQSASDKSEYAGKIGDYEVTIGDAKLVNNNGEDAVIVSFTFKNNSDTEVPFSGVMDVTAYQNGDKLPGTVVANTEGVNMLAIGEHIAKGETIEVQQAYTLRERALPIDVEVRQFESDSEDVLTKSFEF